MNYQRFTSPPQFEPTNHHRKFYTILVFVFIIGLLIGFVIPLIYWHQHTTNSNESSTNNESSSRINESTTNFITNGIFWSALVEASLPTGYDSLTTAAWQSYVNQRIVVNIEPGCGRMQNRLITFNDGNRACVRYRQNTDQIQGELFSFYLAQILNLTNLAPSTISVVDVATPLWSTIASKIQTIPWNSNRAVVMTKFIPDLDVAFIPKHFRIADRHLNKHDVTASSRIRDVIELAQWSDLIVFDYLTANLDRIVNNLYNYQWNVNIMDAPAHNLARNSNLLVFLDNESGLLHGYRLLKKYEVYHSLLLDNLCLFREGTVRIVERLARAGNVGELLRGRFEGGNEARVKEVLPTLPEKTVKILNERVRRVVKQVRKCRELYGT